MFGHDDMPVLMLVGSGPSSAPAVQSTQAPKFQGVTHGNLEIVIILSCVASSALEAGDLARGIRAEIRRRAFEQSGGKPINNVGAAPNQFSKT
jgi:hypothetical protein